MTSPELTLLARHAAERGSAVDRVSRVEEVKRDVVLDHLPIRSKPCTRSKVRWRLAVFGPVAANSGDRRMFSAYNGCSQRRMVVEDSMTLELATTILVALLVGSAPGQVAESLHAAAAQGDRQALAQALDGGVDVDARDAQGYTALHRAVAAKQGLLVADLLAAGAQVDARGPKSETALLLAASSAALHSAVRLLDAGAATEARDAEGRSALHRVAARVGGPRIELAARLVAAGAEVDTRTPGGATPLHVAAYWGAPDFAHWLIDQGADVNARNEMGETPLVIAVRACRPALERVIKAALARSATGSGR